MAVQAPFPLWYGNGNSDGGEWMDLGLLTSDIYQSCQPRQQQQQMMGQLPPPPANPPTASNGLPSSVALLHRPLAMDLSGAGGGSLSYLLEKQRNETDQYLRLQSNRLRAALQQQRRQHLASLLRGLESKASRLLKQREDELAKARRRSMELEACLRRAEAEKEAWQLKAREAEALAASLSHALDRVRDPCLSSTGAAGSSPAPADEDDAASCSGFPTGREGGGESTAAMARCRSCGSRDACVVLLPCRHLCSCRPCAASLEACPLCASVKRGSVVVLMA